MRGTVEVDGSVAGGVDMRFGGVHRKDERAVLDGRTALAAESAACDGTLQMLDEGLLDQPGEFAGDVGARLGGTCGSDGAESECRDERGDE